MQRQPLQFPHLRVLAALFLLCLAWTQPAHAGVVGPGGFSGSETVIDFTGLTTPQTANPLVFGDLTVDSDASDLRVTNLYGPFAGTPEASGGEYLGDLVMASQFEMQFETPITRLGMWINGGNTNTDWTLTAYAATGALVGSHTFTFVSVSYPDPSTFAGIQFPTPFKRVTIVEGGANGQYTSIDDIRFESVVVVPVEESSWGAVKGQF